MIYELTQLPKDLRKQVEDYIEFLMQKYQKKQKDSSKDNPRLSAYGLYAGKIQMSDDFDAPLDDFQEYM